MLISGFLSILPGRGTRLRLSVLRNLCAACAVALAGCATPNLQPFAQETARLADALSGEQRQIAAKFQEVIDLYKKACDQDAAKERLKAPQQGGKPPCEQQELREKELGSFQQSRAALEAVLRSAVRYAATLADLAGAGETGGEAVKSLAGTLERFGALAGLGGALASEAVTAIATRVGLLATRVQAQNSLADATAAADGAIEVIAEGIVAIRKAEERITSALYNDELTLAERIAGPDLIVLYEDARVGRNGVNSRLKLRAEALMALNGCGPESPLDRSRKPDPCDALRGDLRNAAELSRLIELLRPDYDAYAARRTAAVRWYGERRENFQAVANASAAWRAEHARVAAHLQRCGGLRFTRCAEINAASLKVLIDQVNEIRALKEK
jgi:hypothetical protein